MLEKQMEDVVSANWKHILDEFCGNSLADKRHDENNLESVYITDDKQNEDYAVDGKHTLDEFFCKFTS